MGNFAGTLGGHFTLHQDVSEVSVDTNNNQSTVRCHLYITCDSTGTGVFDLTNGANWSTSVNGNNRSGNFTYDERGNSNTIDLVTYDTVVGHDGNGDASIGYSGSANMNNSPYTTTASTGGSLGLTHINRFANINSFTASSITDVGFTISVSTDVTCSSFDYSLDNGANWTNVAGAFTSKSSGVGGSLKSGTTYPCLVRVYNQTSGLTTTSGTLNVTTLVQNRFFVTGGM